VTVDPVRGELRRDPLRLVPQPSERRANDLPVRFVVGDVVVYASYGIGRVDSTRRDGVDAETITLGFESGLTVILPLERAFQALRPLSDEDELVEVRRTLRAQVEVPVEPWSRLNRRTREKVASGRVGELAEVVRDGLRREQRRSASGRMPAPSDRQLYVQARTLLAAEIAHCRGIEPAEAETWILDQVAVGSDEL
jgi:CarD family transcriptional regulator, regulator of rRNA transcription